MTTEAQFLEPDPAIEASARAVGEGLFRLMDAHPSPGILSRKGAYARIMEWSMKDPAFKAQLFRFVDVLPSLGSSAEIVRHLQEYLGDKAVELSPAMKTGLAAAAFAPALVAGPVKANVTSMAAQFVAGATPGDLVKRLRSNAAAGIATTIDLLGETVVSAAEADAFLQRNLDVLDTVGKAVAKDAKPCFSDIGPGGPLPRLNLSVKVSALTPEVHPADPGRSIAALKERLRPILRRAGEIGAFINFDMESYGLKDLTLSLFRSILSEDEFRGQPAVGIAMQAYLRDCERDLLDLIAWARRAGRLAGARVVGQARERRELREALAPPARERGHRGAGVRLPQRPLLRVRHGAGRAARDRTEGLRVPGALRHGGRAQVGARRIRAARARVLPRGRPPSRDGLPRPQAPREHLERGFPEGEGRRRRDARRAASKPRRAPGGEGAPGGGRRAGLPERRQHRLQHRGQPRAH